MLPRITGFARMKWIPEKSEAKVVGWRARALRSWRMRAMKPDPTKARAPAAAARNRRPEPVKKAADGGPDNRRSLESPGRPCDCLRDQRLRHERGEQGLRRRALERPGGSDQTHEYEDAGNPEPMAPRSKGEDRARDALHSERNSVHRAAVVAVGHVPGDQREKDDGHELDEPRHPQHEGAVREVVDLPADGHGEDLERDTGCDARAPEPAVGRMRKRSARASVSPGVRWGFIRGECKAASWGNRRT